jgi:peptidoglycan/xylan/chitin deacetylase (PgdA/CDA1 family)
MNRVKYAYNSGHQIGSHTWSHKDLTTLTWDQSKCLFFAPSRLEKTHVCRLILVHDEMWRVEREFSFFF